MFLLKKISIIICLSLFTTFAYADAANDILNRLTEKISSISILTDSDSLKTGKIIDKFIII